MPEERIETIETPEGNTHTSTMIVTEKPRSGISGWFVMFVVLLAVVVAIWAFTQFNGPEAAKDNAIADAANSVGDAAQQVGDAAQDAAGSARQAADNAGGE